MFRLICGLCSPEQFGDRHEVDLSLAQGAVLQGQTLRRADDPVVLEMGGQTHGGPGFRANRNGSSRSKARLAQSTVKPKAGLFTRA